jgi:sugar phosphate isomerase/epimerase
MVVLSAFADEISDVLDEQITVLRRESVGYVDMRGVEGRNVLDLSQREAREVRDTLDRNDIGIAALASPVGKCPVGTPLGELRERLEHAAALAHVFGTPWVRIFSFYPPGDTHASGPASTAAWRDAVLERLAAMATWARECGVALLVENERRTYADTIERCVEVLSGVGGDHLGLVFDAANFVQCGQRPHPEAYEALRPWLRHVHVKDVAADGRMVVAGRGVAQWPALLRAMRQDGYTGFISLEPHLTRAGQFGGFTGPVLFREAVRALRSELAAAGWTPDQPRLAPSHGS